MQDIPPNISTSSEAAVPTPTQTPASTITSNTSLNSAQELIRAIAESTVTILNDRISQTENDQTSSCEDMIGTRTSLQQILSSDTISSAHSSFIIEVFNESREPNSLLSVAGVIACLYFKLQVLSDASADPEKETITDADFIEFIRNSQIALHNFHRVVQPEELPDDLKIYHLKIRNIDKLLAWWLRKPYPIGKEFTITFHSLSQTTCDVNTLLKACSNNI